ncbi:MAG: hypothetical protein GC145_06255 [Caulobacter sp.]|nr:hypothetical protein [Caulobacter sp.]
MAFISEEDALALARPEVSIGFFVLIKSAAGWGRMWSGHGDYYMPVNLIDTVGGIYRGAGEITGLPDIAQLLNALADRVEFSMSGVSAEVLAIIAAEASLTVNAPIHLGMIGMDSSNLPVTDPIWLWEGEADVPRVARSSDASDDGEFVQVRSASLSAVTIFSGRRRPVLGFFTGIDQRRRYPDDAFCDRANRYSSGTTRKFP